MSKQVSVGYLCRPPMLGRGWRLHIFTYLASRRDDGTFANGSACVTALCRGVQSWSSPARRTKNFARTASEAAMERKRDSEYARLVICPRCEEAAENAPAAVAFAPTP